jgi:predicted nucleotidyltransferase
MTHGHAWISALGPGLERHRHALLGLLGFCEASPTVTSLSVGCSLGRGAADELSDVDAAVGVDAEPGSAGASRVREVEQALVDHLGGDGLVDVLREETSSSDFLIRKVFGQRADGLQLDLAVVAEAEVRRGAAAPDFVAVYRAEEVGEPPPRPSAYDVPGDQVRTWAFLGWRALLDADKYLRRGSAWEAHQRLEEVRHRIWQLWATATGASYPWHGLSQVLDHDPARLPAGIDSTVAGLDLTHLRAAVLAAADVLEDASAAAVDRVPAALPTALAAHARRRMASR